MAFSRKNKINRVIRQVYGRKYNLALDHMAVEPGYAMTTSSVHDLLARWKPRPTRKQKITIALLLLSALLAIKMIMAVYYYNVLIDTQQNMMAAYANIDALMQRRNDIARNLSKAVYDYSKYEQQVFTSVVSLRTYLNQDNGTREKNLAQLQEMIGQGNPQDVAPAAGVPAATGQAAGGDLLASLSKLMAVAEQYPDLKLSTNFESLMAALVQVETDLAAERIKFNAETNVYTTNVARFPCNLFAWYFGFEKFDYFAANDEARTFKLIGY